MLCNCILCGAGLGEYRRIDKAKCKRCSGLPDKSISEIQQVLNIVESLDVRMDRMEALMEPKPRTRDDAIGCEPNWLWFPPTVIGRGESAAMADDVFGPGNWERYGFSQIRRKPTAPEFPTDSTLGAVDDSPYKAHDDLMDQVIRQREAIENLRSIETGIKSRLKEANSRIVSLSFRQVGLISERDEWRRQAANLALRLAEATSGGDEK